MRIIIFADSHGNSQRMLDAIQHEQNVDACIFLGDGISDTEDIHEAFPHLPLYLVRGNCDGALYAPEEGLVPVGGMLIYGAHGHTLGVKNDLDMLWWTAQRRGANAALFGHTHIPYYENRGGIHLFNPGSISTPRFGARTYGIMTVDKGEAKFEIVKVT